MRTSKQFFEAAIEAELKRRAEQDEHFAESFSNPDKTIEACANYVIRQAKKLASKESPGVGLTDAQVYNLAMHYYDEDLKVDEYAEIKAQIVSNGTVGLTDKEKAEVREKAKQELLEQEKQKRIKKSKPVSTPVTDQKERPQTSLF